MKILAIGDIHMSVDNINRIEFAKDADLIVINGDLTNYGTTRDAKNVLDDVMAVNPNVLVQYGNLDKPEINSYLEGLGINLHNQARLLKNRVCLFGVGGSNITPFSTPVEFTEEEIATLLENGHDQAMRYIQLAEPIEKIKIPLILVSHTPPLNTTTDRLRSGNHVGSEAVRNYIEQCQPNLCIAGHIHEAKGCDQIGKTAICNPGMFRDGGWLEIQVNKSDVTTILHEHP